MNLTRHQRKIINAIIDGNVYNIPTYLRYFQKGEVKKYNIEELRKKHKEAEKGKKYKVMKKGHSAYISISTEMQMGLLGSASVPQRFPRNRKDITDDEWTNEEARFIEKIPKTCFSFRETDYTFDLLEEGAFIANDFQDIIDFITLWSFLKNEMLILELEQPVSIDEVSEFFEYRKLDKKSKKEEESTVWVKTNDTIVSNDNKLFKSLPLDFYEETPSKTAEQYLDGIWEINNEHIIMCSEFIGKRIYPTSDLRVYAKHYYRTVDELDRAINKWLASIALVISILSFAWSLLQPQTDYHAELEKIVSVTTELKETIELKHNKTNVDTMVESLNIFEWLHLKTYCDSIRNQLMLFQDMFLDALPLCEESPSKDNNPELSE